MREKTFLGNYFRAENALCVIFLSVFFFQMNLHFQKRLSRALREELSAPPQWH